MKTFYFVGAACAVVAMTVGAPVPREAKPEPLSTTQHHKLTTTTHHANPAVTPAGRAAAAAANAEVPVAVAATTSTVHVTETVTKIPDAFLGVYTPEQEKAAHEGETKNSSSGVAGEQAAGLSKSAKTQPRSGGAKHHSGNGGNYIEIPGVKGGRAPIIVKLPDQTIVNTGNMSYSVDIKKGNFNGSGTFKKKKKCKKNSSGNNGGNNNGGDGGGGTTGADKEVVKLEQTGDNAVMIVVGNSFD